MYDVITIGSATRDAFFEGLPVGYHHDDPHGSTKETFCLPLAAKVRVGKVTFTTGGAGTNAAVTFARHGLKTGAIVRVGLDVSGQEIEQNLFKEGIDTALLQKDPLRPTSYSVILMTEGAERTILVYKGAGSMILASEIPWNTIKTKWMYVDSIAGNDEILQGIIKLKKERQSLLMWNPGTSDLSRGLEWFRQYVSYFDIFMANKNELCELFSLPYEKEDDIMSALDELIEGIAIMTKGPEGVAVSDGKKRYSAGVFPENALIDRTGAGDAFGSGFLVGYIKGNSIEEGIRVGAANSTSVLEYIGAKEGILRAQNMGDARWQKLVIQALPAS